MKLAVGKILGNAEGKNWEQVYDFTPEEGAKLTSRGRLVAVASIAEADCPEGMTKVQAGKEILSRLHELYYGEVEMGALERLKIAIIGVEEEFAGAEIAGAAFIGGAIYVAATPGTGIWVKIEDKEGWLVNAEGRDSLTAASGWAKDGEVMIMGNSVFWKNISPEGLKSAVAHAGQGMEEVVETLATSVQAGGQAGVIIQVAEVSVIQTEEEEVVVPEVKEEKFQVVKNKTNWKEKGQKLWGKLKSKTKSQGVYVVNGEDLGEQKRKKRMMYVGLVIVAVWVGLAGIGQIRSKKIEAEQSVENKTIETIQSQYQEAAAVVGLNPARSKELLAQIQQEIAGLAETGKKDPRIVEINKGYGDVLGAATGTKTAVIKEVQDLSLTRDGVDASAMAMGDDNQLLVLDKKGSRIFGVNVSTGSTSVIAGQSDLGTPRLMTTYPGKVVILSDKGVVECLTANNQCGVKIKPDEAWKNILGMKMWAANIYMTDAGAGQVWKYSGSDSGFGTRQEWLEEADSSLGQSLGMAIDGSVWVLENGGVIKKYTRGVGENITINGMDQTVGDGAVIYTDDNQDKLYILDPKNKRVMAVNKTGEYASQWKSDKFGEMKDVVVDEKQGKMWLAGGHDVIEVQL